VRGKVDGEARLRYSWSTTDYSNRYQSDPGSAGVDGLLSAGNYTLVVGGFATSFPSTIADMYALEGSHGKSGEYQLQFISNASTIPTPSASLAGLLGFGVMAAMRRKRKA
jgi:hypothetical protein